MPIAKEKFPETSMKHHEAMPKAEQVGAKKLPARSAAQLSHASCEEMIQNLKRNVVAHTASTVSNLCKVHTAHQNPSSCCE